MQLPKRKLPRLIKFDYATPGGYFVTLCADDKKCVFGRVITDDSYGEAYVQYSAIGEIAKKELLDIESHYSNVKVDNWVIMPNHVYILLRITQVEENPAVQYDIPNVVGKYKGAVTRAVGKMVGYSVKLWQNTYHDHIIRNKYDYQKIWQYISGNPSKWLDDCFYCAME